MMYYDSNGVPTVPVQRAIFDAGNSAEQFLSGKVFNAGISLKVRSVIADHFRQRGNGGASSLDLFKSVDDVLLKSGHNDNGWAALGVVEIVERYEV